MAGRAERAARRAAKRQITEAIQQEMPSNSFNTVIEQTATTQTNSKKRPLDGSHKPKKKKRKYVFRTYINIPQNLHAFWRELCSLPEPSPKIVFKKYKYSITNALRRLQIPHPIWQKKLALFKSLLSSNEEFLQFLARHQLAYSDKLETRDDMLKIKLIQEVLETVKELEQELEQQQLEHRLQLLHSSPIPKTPLRFVHFCPVQYCRHGIDHIIQSNLRKHVTISSTLCTCTLKLIELWTFWRYNINPFPLFRIC